MLKACQFRKRVHLLNPWVKGVLKISAAGGMDTKGIKDEVETLGMKSIDGLPVQEKSTSPEPLGEGVLEISTAGGMDTKGIKDE